MLSSFFFLSGILLTLAPMKFQTFSLFKLKLALSFWLELGDLFASQSSRGCYAFHFQGQSLICAYNVCLHVQILVSLTISS